MEQAIQAFELALQGLTVPMNGSPIAGKRVFSSCFTVGVPGSDRLGTQCIANPAIAACGCAVTGITVIRNDCACYSQNFDGKNQCVEIMLKTLGENPGAEFMLQVTEDSEPLFFELPDGSEEETNERLMQDLLEREFTAEFDDEEMIIITALPNGEVPTEVWAAGFVDGGNVGSIIGIRVCDVLPMDFPDIQQIDQ